MQVTELVKEVSFWTVKFKRHCVQVTELVCNVIIFVYCKVENLYVQVTELVKDVSLCTAKLKTFTVCK